MTQLEKFINLYRDFGLELEIVFDEKRNIQAVKMEPSPQHGTKFIGYSFFHSVAEFDMEGNFLRQGFWE